MRPATKAEGAGKIHVRYERSQSDHAGSRPHLAPRTRALITAATLMVIIVIVVVVNSGSSQYAKTTGTPSQIRATERAFLLANILVENLGALTPSSETTSSWLLTSHPITKDRQGVVAAEYEWIDRTGRFNVVTLARALRERAAQQRVISSIFDGTAKGDIVSEMNQIIDSEMGSHPHVSAPGGAKIVKWLKVHMHGITADLEADVNVWESTLVLGKIDGRYVLSRSLDLNQVDASATLRFSAKRWRVVSFNQAPWQQAT
ncbi:MAG TPA: hypothetical protein VMU99_08550 [Acidimicrobiales bacterium]|nr:hypothetical protein [Acidimicrobiales bacterium]